MVFSDQKASKLVSDGVALVMCWNDEQCSSEHEHQTLQSVHQSRFNEEGKSEEFHLSIGCDRRKHRSVAIAEEIGRRLTKQGLLVAVVHRDIDK